MRINLINRGQFMGKKNDSGVLVVYLMLDIGYICSDKIYTSA